VVNTINAVLAISHALGTVRRELCPGKIHCFHKQRFILTSFLLLCSYISCEILQHKVPSDLSQQLQHCWFCGLWCASCHLHR